MLRKIVIAAPRAANRILSTSVRPAIVSPAHRIAPAAVSARRNYHEKDKSSIVSSTSLRLPAPISPSSPAIHPSQNPQLTFPSLLDHYSSPRNVGSMVKTDADVGTGLVGAPACGDVMKLQIRVDPNSNTISDVKFKTFGCGSAIASSSYLTELVRGMTLEDAVKIRNTEIARELCLPPVKCQFLPLWV